MEAYSLDLRFRILNACLAGVDTREGVAETFGVSRASVQRLLRQWEKQGELTSKPHSGGPLPALDEAALRELRRLVQAKPDATLAELCTALQDSDTASVSLATVCRALQKLDLPMKKRRCTPRSGTRRGCGHCGAGGGTGPGRRQLRTLSSWTKAGPTPR